MSPLVCQWLSVMSVPRSMIIPLPSKTAGFSAVPPWLRTRGFVRSSADETPRPKAMARRKLTVLKRRGLMKRMALTACSERLACR